MLDAILSCNTPINVATMHLRLQRGHRWHEDGSNLEMCWLSKSEPVAPRL
jgi:hypothetical protein